MFNFSPEHKRQKLDRRRIESAFFQYAALRVASFHPDLFQTSKLPLHSETVNTIAEMTTVYHGVFMRKYLRKS